MSRPVFDAASGVGQATAPTSVNWNHTCTGLNLYLLVWLHFNTNVTNISITYNSVSMTQLGTNNSGGRYGYLYGLLSPSTGTNSVDVSWTTASGMAGVSTSYTNVSQSNPTGTVVTAVGTSSPATLNLTTTADYMAVDGVGATRNSSATPPTITVDASQTQRQTQTSAVASAIRLSASDEDGGASSTTMSWTLSNFSDFIQIGVPLFGSAVSNFFF